MSVSKTYAHALRKDLWNELDVRGLFECFEDGGALINLLRSSVAAKTIIPAAWQQIRGDGFSVYCFKPMDVCAWALAKEIPFPEELRK